MTKINSALVLSILFHTMTSYPVSLQHTWKQAKTHCTKLYNVITHRYPATIICMSSALTCAFFSYLAAGYEKQQYTLEQTAIPYYDQLLEQEALKLEDVQQLYIISGANENHIHFSLNVPEFYRRYCNDPHALAQLNDLHSKLGAITCARLISFFIVLVTGIHALQELFGSDKDTETTL